MTIRKIKQPNKKSMRKLTPAKPRAGSAEPLLLNDLRQLIAEARQAASVAVNASLTLMYWRIGQRMYTEVLKQRRADYGDEIVVTVSRQLAAEHGQGFSAKNLQRMIQFAQVFPQEQIVVTLVRQLSWSHFIALIPLSDPLKRDFYAEMCRIERWSVRTLPSSRKSGISATPCAMTALVMATIWNN